MTDKPPEQQRWPDGTDEPMTVRLCKNCGCLHDRPETGCPECDSLDHWSVQVQPVADQAERPHPWSGDIGTPEARQPTESGQAEPERPPKWKPGQWVIGDGGLGLVLGSDAPPFGYARVCWYESMELAEAQRDSLRLAHPTERTGGQAEPEPAEDHGYSICSRCGMRDDPRRTTCLRCDGQMQRFDPEPAEQADEERCENCGEPMECVWWCYDDKLWEAVTGHAPVQGKVGSAAGLWCIRCFDRKAKELCPWIEWAPQNLRHLTFEPRPRERLT